jgi:hypothetical protein
LKKLRYGKVRNNFYEIKLWKYEFLVALIVTF